MSGNNIWGEEEPFQDMPDEAQTVKGKPGMPEHYIPPVQAAATPPRSPERQQVIKQSNAAIEQLNHPEPEQEPEISEEDEEDASVLNDANLRLEQGSLYKMIMKHDLFAGIDADPKAVQNVQKAIRKFAREQMEIMLGMRRESTMVEHLEIDFPFNHLEVEVLRAMAKTFSKGATEESDRYVPEVKRVTSEIPNVPKPVKRTSLNPISNASQKTTPVRQAPKAAAPSRPLPTKARAPVKRTALDEEIDRICAEEGVPRELLEEQGLLSKPVAQLNDQEKMERNKQVAQRRGVQVKNPQALPMPDAATHEMLIASRVPDAMTSKNALFNKIIDQVKQMPMKDPFRDPFG